MQQRPLPKTTDQQTQNKAVWDTLGSAGHIHTHTHTYTYTLLHTHTHMIGFVVINKDIRKRVSDTNKHMIQVSTHTGQYLYRLVSIQVKMPTG